MTSSRKEAYSNSFTQLEKDFMVEDEFYKVNLIRRYLTDGSENEEDSLLDLVLDDDDLEVLTKVGKCKSLTFLEGSECAEREKLEAEPNSKNEDKTKEKL